MSVDIDFNADMIASRFNRDIVGLGVEGVGSWLVQSFGDRASVPPAGLFEYRDYADLLDMFDETVPDLSPAARSVLAQGVRSALDRSDVAASSMYFLYASARLLHALGVSQETAPALHALARRFDQSRPTGDMTELVDYRDALEFCLEMVLRVKTVAESQYQRWFEISGLIGAGVDRTPELDALLPILRHCDRRLKLDDDGTWNVAYAPMFFLACLYKGTIISSLGMIESQTEDEIQRMHKNFQRNVAPHDEIIMFEDPTAPGTCGPYNIEYIPKAAKAFISSFSYAMEIIYPLAEIHDSSRSIALPPEDNANEPALAELSDFVDSEWLPSTYINPLHPQ